VLYVAIYEGPDPDDATAVFGSADPDLIAAFGELIARRLGRTAPPQIRALTRGRPVTGCPPSSEEDACR
jgi:hypothetical protein